MVTAPLRVCLRARLSVDFWLPITTVALLPVGLKVALVKLLLVGLQVALVNLPLDEHHTPYPVPPLLDQLIHPGFYCRGLLLDGLLDLQGFPSLTPACSSRTQPPCS